MGPNELSPPFLLLLKKKSTTRQYYFRVLKTTSLKSVPLCQCQGAGRADSGDAGGNCIIFKSWGLGAFPFSWNVQRLPSIHHHIYFLQGKSLLCSLHCLLRWSSPILKFVIRWKITLTAKGISYSLAQILTRPPQTLAFNPNPSVTVRHWQADRVVLHILGLGWHSDLPRKGWIAYVT